MEEVLVAHVDGHIAQGERRHFRSKIQQDNYPYLKKRLCRPCWCRLTSVSNNSLKRKIHRYRRFQKILKHKNDSIEDANRPALLRAQLAILLVGQKSREVDPRAELHKLARLGTEKVRWIALNRTDNTIPTYTTSILALTCGGCGCCSQNQRATPANLHRLLRNCLPWN